MLKDCFCGFRNIIKIKMILLHEHIVLFIYFLIAPCDKSHMVQCFFHIVIYGCIYYTIKYYMIFSYSIYI